MKQKLIRITTIPLSLEKLLEGQLSYMNNYYEVIAISAEKERLERLGAQEGVQTKYIELTRKITPIADLKAIWQLYKFLRKEEPLIVHTHTPKAGMVGMIAAKMARVPLRLHTVAGLPLLEKTGVLRKILNVVESITYACATNVYPNSYGLKDIIVKEKFTTISKLKVIGKGSTNGIDTKYFDFGQVSEEQTYLLKKELKIGEEDTVFVFVGRLVADKGINELISAFDKLNEAHKNIKLLLVGPREADLDPLLPETDKLIHENENIITVGYQQDVRPYFGIADILTFPSYREGFPNVVMQAHMMNLPAIVSDINGCNEIVIDGRNGLIVPPKDEGRLYDAMYTLLDNRNLCEEMRRVTRQMIVEKYSRDYVQDALLKEYQLLESNLS